MPDAPGLLAGLTDAQIAGVRVACETSHLYFSRFFFKVTRRAPFMVGRHHKVMCDTIDRVFKGEITRLIINIPPRYSKTELAVIYMVARGFALNPRAMFLHSSFSEKLVNDNSSKIRDVIRSPEFQYMWPLALRADSDAKGLWKTDVGGALTVAPADGQVTGFGAGLMESGFTGALIIDDPLKPRDARYDVKREGVNTNYMETFRSRIAHEPVPIIVSGQRVATRDFTEHLLTGEGGEKFHHLMMPVDILEDAAYPTEFTHGEQIPHGLDAGPLWPEKHNEDQIDILRKNSRVFSAQYMQNPRTSNNSVFSPVYFRHYEVRPRTLNVAITVDPSAGRSKTSDRTAMPVIGVDSVGNKYLLDGYCHRMKLSERWDHLKRLWQRWSKATGVMNVTVGYEQYGLQADIEYIKERQELEKDARFPITEVNWVREGSQSKEDRIERLEPDFKNGRFYLPATIYTPGQSSSSEHPECFWEGKTHGVEFRPAFGRTSSQKRIAETGEAWRVAETLKRRDENNQMYDLTWLLMEELRDFPNALFKDLSDATSRVYDLDIIPAPKQEVLMVDGLNESLVA